jgi:hypothetical protein
MRLSFRFQLPNWTQHATSLPRPAPDAVPAPPTRALETVRIGAILTIQANVEEISMSPQDSQLLQDFLNQLVQARDLPKDPEAEAMIQKAVAMQPDAAYLLVQRALLQQRALDNARAEIANLQRQLQGGTQRGEFLDPNAWGNSAGQRQPAQGYVGQVPQQAYPQQYPPQLQEPYQQPSMMNRASSFFRGGGMGGGMGGALGNIASTAAGVAAGAFLFQGLGNLLGHGNHDGNGFLGNNDAFSSLTSPIEDFHNSGGGQDSASSLLGDSGVDSGAGNSLLDDVGSGTDDFAGGNDDGGSDDGLFS